jgi:hypothetical protein
MGLIWTAPAVLEGVEMDATDVVEIFCDGGVISEMAGNIQTVCFRIFQTRTGPAVRPVARLVTPVVGFDWSLTAAQMKRLGRH